MQFLKACGKIRISRTFVIACKQVVFSCKIMCANKQKWSLATDLSCFSGPSIIKKIVPVWDWQLCGLRWMCLVAPFASAENNELAIWWMWREQRCARMQCCDVLLSWDSNLEPVFCCCWSHLIINVDRYVWPGRPLQPLFFTACVIPLEISLNYKAARQTSLFLRVYICW